MSRQFNDGKIIWLSVPGHPNYEVSCRGDVRNAKTKKVLKQEVTYRGYARVRLDSDKHHYIHRLVADAFYDGNNGNLDINHLNGDKLDNFIGNLERCTRSENIHHAFQSGLKPTKAKIVRCKYCIYRNENPYCRSKSDDFFCADGRLR